MYAAIAAALRGSARVSSSLCTNAISSSIRSGDFLLVRAAIGKLHRAADRFGYRLYRRNQLGKMIGTKLLRAIGKRNGGVRMYLDEQAVGARRDRGQRHRLHQRPQTGAMTGIDD